MAPTGSVLILECLGVRKRIWALKNAAGSGVGVREPMAGAVQGQNNLASGRPGILQASSYLGGDGFSTVHVCVSSWDQSMCVHMGLCACVCRQKCDCVGVSVHVPGHVQAEDSVCLEQCVYVCVHACVYRWRGDCMLANVCDCERLCWQMCKHLGCGHWQTTNVTVCMHTCSGSY